MASAPPATGSASPEAGPAHVAVVSFLAARAAPSGGFWIALAGGVALARVAERRGARAGFGASAAAMLETVAIIGPARFGVPLTQALSAPLLGRLHARRVGFWPQLLACAAVRLLHNAATTAFFIWVIAGGLDAYAGTYDAIGRRVGVEVGTADALALTLAGLLAWAAFASTVQVLVYRRGLRGWEGEIAEAEQGARERQHRGEPDPLRFDPRAVACASVVAFALLLSSTEWLLIAAVSGWLAAAWLLSRAERGPVPAGLLFAAVLGGGALIFALAGGFGLDTALRRASRAALLVLVATWLRAAAGAAGLREVSRRVLRRLRAVPSANEAARVLDAIASEGRLAAAARSLAARVSEAPRRPVAFLDAVLAWVMRESESFRRVPPSPPLRLASDLTDWVFAASAALPALALAYL
jgi:hypothetical protein